MVTTLQPATPMSPTPESAPAAQLGEPPPTRTGVLARAGAFLGVLLLALAYILPGLTGRDPWGPDEAVSVGIIHHMATTGDLVVPTLAGEPVLEDPPAYYIGAAGMVRLVGHWLPMHDAARITTGLCLAMTLLFVGLMARRSWGPGLGGAAVLALIGSLALVQYGHVMVPDGALMAGMAMGGYGLLRARESVAWGGLWLGTGCGLAFLSKGLFGPCALAAAALLLLFFADWRGWVYMRALAVALVVALPWLLVWPAELYLRDPELYRSWLLNSTPVASLGTVALHPPTQGDFWLRTLPWVTFPVLPLACWTLVRRPSAAFGNPGVRVALAVSLVGWGLLLWSSTARDLYAIPLLPPLAVIAAGGVRDLPAWLVTLCYWLSLLIFAAIAAVLWGLWAYGLAAGHPPQLPLIGDYLPLDFRPDMQGEAALLALAMTLTWVLAVKRLGQTPTAALAAWPLGLTLVLGLVSLLHLAWMDAAESYRGVFRELAVRLPQRGGCVTTPGRVGSSAGVDDWTRMSLRPSQLGLLDYLAGVKPVAAGSLREASCDWVLVRLGRGHPSEGVDLGPGWEKVWEGRRPVDRRDSFMLLRWSEDVVPPEYLGMPVAPGGERRSGGSGTPDPAGVMAPAPQSSGTP
jgi:4-amino-4-deoxy-L-arabinose transferase-like glycosyltransferase